MGEPTRACGCPLPAEPGWYGLISPRSEVLLELDADGRLLGGFPHISELLAAPLCRRTELADVVPPAVATLMAATASQLAHEGDRHELEVPDHGLAIRFARTRAGVLAVLTRTDASFWQLFEVAPLPLAVEVAVTPDGHGASRHNRKFRELFGYSTDEVPSVHHWWPLAYPDPEYRERVREEWFRRVSQAVADSAAIEPMRTTVTCKDGTTRDIEFFAAAVGDRHVVVFVDRTEHNRLAQLEQLLPVCAWCKKLRDDQGSWHQLEQYVRRQTGATVTHGICPDCTASMRAG
jgi:PAS domain-containing protein